MRKEYTPFVIGMIICFGLGLLVASLFYSGKAGTTWGRAYAVSDIMGSPAKNPHGEDFGWIDDFVIDTNGRVAFAIISYGDKEIAVPFSGLDYDREMGSLVLDTTKERLDSAQAFDKSMLENRESAEEIYRHFGVSPYWTEAVSEVASPGMQDFPMEAPSSEQYTWP
jgi:hypothetical protein